MPVVAVQHVGAPSAGLAQSDRGGREPQESAGVASIAGIDGVAGQLLEIEHEHARARLPPPAAIPGLPAGLDLGQPERPAEAFDGVLRAARTLQMRVVRQQHTNVVTARAKRVAQPCYRVGQSAGFRPRGELRADHQDFHRATCAAPSGRRLASSRRCRPGAAGRCADCRRCEPRASARSSPASARWRTSR
jgi:hypothetical protein